MCHFSHRQRGMVLPVGSILADSGSIQGPAAISTICNVCVAFPTGKVRTPVGSILVGSGSVQAAGWEQSIICNAFCAIHSCRGSTGTQAGAIQADSNSVKATGSKLSTICNVCVDHNGRGRTPVGSILVGSGSVQAAS